MCSMLVSPAYVMVCGDGVRDMVRMAVHIRYMINETVESTSAENAFEIFV